MSITNKIVQIVMCALLICLLMTNPAISQETEPLVVHEWGTITSEHYNNGASKGSLNHIRPEEVLPEFVHNMGTVILTKGFSKSPNVSGHPSVTMRLETPVIYFYPPPSFDLSQPIDVEVEFHGGLINEYYPQAQVMYKNIETSESGTTYLTKEALGQLSWKAIHIGGPWPGPETDSSIWLSPREVPSANVQSAEGESERYLFYRGVANLNSLFTTRHDMNTKEVTFYNPTDLPLLKNNSLTVPSVWIVHIKDDGTTAFKEIGSIALSDESDKLLTTVSVNFPENEYTLDNLTLLRQSIHKALLTAGLFSEEAQAMLKTWEKAYFRNPGTRIFFIVPRDWIDHYLPLKFSVQVQLERVFIGRIDLVI